LKLENSWKFNFEIWMKVDEFHLEVKNVLSTKTVRHFQLKSCHFNVGWKFDTCKWVLTMLWVQFNIVNYFGRQLKMSFWVEKNILQLEVTFSTSKCSWNHSWKPRFFSYCFAIIKWIVTWLSHGVAKTMSHKWVG
jgi:hypothetical protein